MSNKLTAVVTANITQFKGAMGSIGGTAGAAASAVVVAFAAAAGAVTATAVASLAAAKSYETLQLRVQLLAGDMKKGAAEFKIIKKLAEESAFDTEELISAYLRLRTTMGADLALEDIEDIAYIAKVSGTNVEELSRRLSEVFIKIKSGATGGELAETIRSMAMVFGEATPDIVKFVKSGADADAIINKMRETVKRLGPEAKKAFANSAEGLEATLKGAVQGKLASIGEGGGGMEAYKEILKELIKLSGEYDTELAMLSAAIGDLLQSILELVKTDEFKEFLRDGITGLVLLTDGFKNLIDWVKATIKITKALFDNSQWGMIINAVNPGKSSYSAEEVQKAAKQSRAEEKQKKAQTEYLARTANTLDPSNEASKQ